MGRFYQGACWIARPDPKWDVTPSGMAGRGQRHPISHPLPEVPQHVTRADVRGAAWRAACVRHNPATHITGRTIRRPQGRGLPLGVTRQPLP